MGLALIALIAFGACNSTPKGLTIEGEISNASNLRVFVDEIKANNSTMVLDQTEADVSGKFSINFPEGLDRGIYRFRIGQQKLPLILEGDEKQIVLKGKLNEIDRGILEISGAPATEAYVETMQAYYNGNRDVSKLMDEIKGQENALVSMQLALQLLGSRADFYEVHKEISDRVQAEYQDVGYAKDYLELVVALERQHKMMQAQQKIKIGEPAPEIALPDPDGNIMKLSDLKGKVVLLDFWASWCGPCRKANPHVVETYHKYKDRGFTVYSVSLDGLDSRTKSRLGDESAIKTQLETSKKRWLQAIETDKLAWDTHVSDLKKWECEPAGEYGVRSIPRTFLIDRDGKIAAINPRFNLEDEIIKLL